MKKCLVAMSGGVDSAVVAYLLKKDGYEIAGATMSLLDNEASKQAIMDAEDICNTLGIKHYVFHLEKEFKMEVIDYFVKTYQEGKTPNPCVICNQRFKFGYFYTEAKKLGYSYIATGHYAKVKDGRLFFSKNLAKDQSYFLYGIDKELLQYVLFPLADFSNKEDVRKIAETAGISASRKKDSEDICFIPDNNYKTYLESSITNITPGDITLKDGKVIGRHEGVEFYTVGQRRGLGVAYSYPLYVVELDRTNNRVIVGKNEDLMHQGLIANNIQLLVDSLPERIDAKVRSRGKMEQASVIWLGDDKIKVTFDRKQRAITKGQSIVFYSRDECLGGGIIEEVI